MGDGPPADALVEVRLLALPLAAYKRAAEHNDELLREFALIKGSEPEPRSPVPARLLALIDELTARYRPFTATPSAARDEAMARGEAQVDLVYRVPPDAKQACLQLGTLLDEADEFCRAGEGLLTLATPPDALAFRRWFLGEFVRQIDGTPPTPFPGAAAGGG
jgi:hypothetical protein